MHIYDTKPRKQLIKLQLQSTSYQTQEHYYDGLKLKNIKHPLPHPTPKH